MRAVLTLMAMFLAGTQAAGTQAAEIVRVGGYPFPPFVEVQADGSHGGFTQDLIERLNIIQDRFEFRFVPVSSRRRYADIQNGNLDAIFFESPEWGWADSPVEFSQIFLKGGEVFIAQSQPGRGQDYFTDFKDKRLVGILGYHYGFADFNSDPDLLAKTYNMKLVTSHRSSIAMVLAGRADIAVVTDSYLWTYQAANPASLDRLLVSDRYDQIYNHRILVRSGGPMDVSTINTLLTEMEKDGTLARLRQATDAMKR